MNETPNTPSESATRRQARPRPSTWMEDLLMIYTDDEAVDWLRSPHKLLNGFSAFDTIRLGNETDVEKIVKQLADGAYV